MYVFVILLCMANTVERQCILQAEPGNITELCQNCAVLNLNRHYSFPGNTIYLDPPLPGSSDPSVQSQ